MITGKLIPGKWCIRLISLWLGALALLVSAQAAAAQQVFTTQRTAIHYANLSDLQELERRLSRVAAGEPQNSFTPDPMAAALCPGLAEKVDGLLTRVCRTLNRWPKQSQRLRIFLLADGKQVKQRQLALQPFQQERSFFGYGRLEGFYEPRTRTIFLSMADFRDGILAHEMAHFVLCEAFTVAPPQERQEEWARYVEKVLD